MKICACGWVGETFDNYMAAALGSDYFDEGLCPECNGPTEEINMIRRPWIEGVLNTHPEAIEFLLWTDREIQDMKKNLFEVKITPEDERLIFEKWLLQEIDRLRRVVEYGENKEGGQ